MTNFTGFSLVISPDLRMLHQCVIPDQGTRSMKRTPVVMCFQTGFYCEIENIIKTKKSNNVISLSVKHLRAFVLPTTFEAIGRGASLIVELIREESETLW